VQLWDGDDYCETCVADASERLLECVRNNDEFVESIPISAKQIALKYIRAGLLMPFLFGAILAVDAILGNLRNWAGFRQVVIIVPLVLLMFPAAYYVKYAGSLPRSVKIAGGLITITNGEGRRRLQSQLGDCAWRLGSARDDTHVGRFLPKNKSAVLVVLPISSIRSLVAIGGGEVIACGWTDDTFEILSAFLRLRDHFV
jgi:hypothetical protein